VSFLTKISLSYLGAWSKSIFTIAVITLLAPLKNSASSTSLRAHSYNLYMGTLNVLKLKFRSKDSVPQKKEKSHRCIPEGAVNAFD
jgi:hypothetical protein